MLFPIYEMPTGDSLSLPTTIPLWALTLIPPPCGLRPRGRNQVRAFRSPFLTRRWYALCVGSCKCINRERMAPAVLLNLFDSWDTGFDRSDHSLISSSSLHFVGIDTVVVALYMIAPAHPDSAPSGLRPGGGIRFACFDWGEYEYEYTHRYVEIPPQSIWCDHVRRSEKRLERLTTYLDPA